MDETSVFNNIIIFLVVNERLESTKVEGKKLLDVKTRITLFSGLSNVNDRWE